VELLDELELLLARPVSRLRRLRCCGFLPAPTLFAARTKPRRRARRDELLLELRDLERELLRRLASSTLLLQRDELVDETLVVLSEHEGHRAKLLDILFLGECARGRPPLLLRRVIHGERLTRSAEGDRAVGRRPDRRTKSQSAHVFAALEEERELAQRPSIARPTVPRRGEPALRKALRKKTETRAIPPENLRVLVSPADEDEQIAFRSMRPG